MVQVGLNGGPRHARKIGWAKSYTKKLDKFVKIEHDLDLVGAASILWALAQAYLPEEVIKDCEAAMERENVPRMSTQNIPAGMYLSFCVWLILMCYSRLCWLPS